MQEITSRRNPAVLYAASLLTRKGREEAHAFPAEGEKLFLEAVSAGAEIQQILVSAERRDRIFAMIGQALGHPAEEDPRVILLPASTFEKVSSEKAPQGIVTILKSLDFSKKYIKIDKKDLSSDPTEKMMVLYSVRDPGNLGAILRSASAFGFRRLLLSADCAELENPKTVRAAMGAIFRVRCDVIEEMDSLPDAVRGAGRRIFSAELKEGARSLTEISLRGSDLIVIGNEGHGIPPAFSRCTDGSVYIPIAPGTESLNASVAASLFLWEVGRKD